jgi:hypothetical protein
MTALDRIRDVAMLMPEVEERADGARTIFAVAGRDFATCDAASMRFRTSDDAGPAWLDLALDDDTDWTLVEDRIARAWELTAPPRLLEAGGR